MQVENKFHEWLWRIVLKSGSSFNSLIRNNSILTLRCCWGEIIFHFPCIKTILEQGQLNMTKIECTEEKNTNRTKYVNASRKSCPMKSGWSWLRSSPCPQANKENDEKKKKILKYENKKYCANASRKSCPVKSDRSGSLRRASPPEPSQFSGTVPQRWEATHNSKKLHSVATKTTKNARKQYNNVFAAKQVVIRWTLGWTNFFFISTSMFCSRVPLDKTRLQDFFFSNL